MAQLSRHSTPHVKRLPCQPLCHHVYKFDTTPFLSLTCPYITNMVTIKPNDQVAVQTQISDPHSERSVAHTLNLDSKTKLSELSLAVKPLLGKHLSDIRGIDF